jgi:antitoxin (DNA-binding transcriptional repressor) of toxin-antitoxin stability system
MARQQPVAVTELDIGPYRGAMGTRLLVAAVDRAQRGGCTMLTEDGAPVAAIVPAEVARAWLEARQDLQEAEEMAGRLGEMARIFRGETGPDAGFDVERHGFGGGPEVPQP